MPKGVYIRSAERRAIDSAAQTGKHLSPETRTKLSAAMMGNTHGLGHRHSAETRAKMSAARSNPSAEYRAKLSAARVGLRPSPEALAKRSASMMGKHLSEETRKKIGAANRGRIPSEETRQKLRDARLGWHHSPETRAKILASLNRPEVAAKLRAKRALRIFPLYDTKPEIAVQGWLLSHGIEFTKHRCIPGLNHQWDIKIESQKTLVEVDGCYWHACPVPAYNQDKRSQ